MCKSTEACKSREKSHMTSGPERLERLGGEAGESEKAESQMALKTW